MIDDHIPNGSKWTSPPWNAPGEADSPATSEAFTDGNGLSVVAVPLVGRWDGRKHTKDLKMETTEKAPPKTGISCMGCWHYSSFFQVHPNPTAVHAGTFSTFLGVSLARRPAGWCSAGQRKSKRTRTCCTGLNSTDARSKPKRQIFDWRTIWVQVLESCTWKKGRSESKVCFLSPLNSTTGWLWFELYGDVVWTSKRLELNSFGAANSAA